MRKNLNKYLFEMLINAIEPEEEKSSQRQFVDKIL